MLSWSLSLKSPTSAEAKETNLQMEGDFTQTWRDLQTETDRTLQNSYTNILT